jgi:flagellar FliL protein
MANPKVNFVQKAAAGAAEAGIEKVKNSIPQWIFIAVPLMFVIWGTGIFTIKKMLEHRRESELATSELKKKTEEAEKSLLPKNQVFTFDTMHLSIADDADLRNFEIQIALESDSSLMSNEINSNLDQIQDELTMLISAKTVKEILATRGRKDLQNEILGRINRILQKTKVKQVYFTNYLLE